MNANISDKAVAAAMTMYEDALMAHESITERDAMEAALLAAYVVLRADIAAEVLAEAADAIQALHPGEVKNSVTFLRDRAAPLSTAKADE